MTASMLSKVVTAHEASFTNRTDKLFLTSVCSPVTRELIRARKFFVTALPVTAEWLLACRNRHKQGWLKKCYMLSDSCVNNNNTESQQTLFFLTCVSPEVCLEVRALEIGLPATRGAADIITPTGEL